jgi:hypothetical protein
MRTRLDGARLRLGVYQFAEDAFEAPRPTWHRACVIGGQRYRITDDLAFCLRALAACQYYLDHPSVETSAALRAVLAEPDMRPCT